MSFDQVGAALAAMTRLGFDAEEVAEAANRKFLRRFGAVVEFRGHLDPERGLVRVSRAGDDEQVVRPGDGAEAALDVGRFVVGGDEDG